MKVNNHVLSCHNSIHRICWLLCIRWKNKNVLLKVWKNEFFLETFLRYHKVYFSATWCKRSWLYDQTIEDINIFYHAVFVELRGGGGWLKLPGGSNYPTLPYICGHFVKAKKNCTRRMPTELPVATRRLLDIYGDYTDTPGCIRWLYGDCRMYTVATRRYTAPTRSDKDHFSSV